MTKRKKAQQYPQCLSSRNIVTYAGRHVLEKRERKGVFSMPLIKKHHDPIYGYAC